MFNFMVIPTLIAQPSHLHSPLTRMNRLSLVSAASRGEGACNCRIRGGCTTIKYSMMTGQLRLKCGSGWP